MAFVAVVISMVFFLVQTRERRNDASAVAAVNAGFLDVLHDGADHGGLAVGDAIDIDFGGIFQEAIHQDRALGADLDCVRM